MVGPCSMHVMLRWTPTPSLLHAMASQHHVELLKKGVPGHVVKTCGLAAVTFNEGADLDRIIQLTDGHDMMGRCDLLQGVPATPVTHWAGTHPGPP